MEDVVNYRDTLHDSDHSLRCARICLTKGIVVPPRKQKTVANALRLKQVGEELDIALSNRFSALLDDQEEGHIEDEMEIEDLDGDQQVSVLWEQLKEEIHKVGANQKLEMKKNKPWITEGTMRKIHERTAVRSEVYSMENPLQDKTKELKRIRKEVKDLVRSDRKTYYEALAEEAEKASNTGNMRKVYQIVGKLRGGRGGAANLQGVNVDEWVGFFKSLLGQTYDDDDNSDDNNPGNIREKLAWKKAGEWIDDKKKYAPKWDIMVDHRHRQR
jgi:hypothetical protein